MGIGNSGFSGNIVDRSLLNNPVKIIGVILAVVIVVATGFAILSATYTGLGSDGVSYTDTFAVTNPAIDQVVNLSHTPDSSTVVVEQYNGFNWLTVSTTYVSINGDQVTVGSGGLQG